MNSKRKGGEKQIQYLPTATFHPGDKLLLLLGGEPMTIDPAEAKTTFLTAHKLPPLSVFDSETQRRQRSRVHPLPSNDLSGYQRLRLRLNAYRQRWRRVIGSKFQ